VCWGIARRRELCGESARAMHAQLRTMSAGLVAADRHDCQRFVVRRLPRGGRRQLLGEAGPAAHSAGKGYQASSAHLSHNGAQE
jgi:hypothetical protein